MKKLLLVFIVILSGCMVNKMPVLDPTLELKEAKDRLDSELKKGELTKCEYNELLVWEYELYGVDGIIPKPKKRLHVNVYFK